MLSRTCPYCGRSNALRKDGTYMQHSRYTPTGDVACEAVGRRADDERFVARARPYRLANDAALSTRRLRAKVRSLRDQIATTEHELPLAEERERARQDELAAWDLAHPEVAPC